MNGIFVSENLSFQLKIFLYKTKSEGRKSYQNKTFNTTLKAFHGQSEILASRFSKYCKAFNMSLFVIIPNFIFKLFLISLAISYFQYLCYWLREINNKKGIWKFLGFIYLMQGGALPGYLVFGIRNTPSV